MTLKNNFYNFDFSNEIIFPKNNHKIISEIKETLFNLPALNIINNNKLLIETVKKVNQFAKNKFFFLIFGTGGSNLGAKALINIFQENQKVNLIFFDNIDPVNFENTINSLNLNNAGFIFISKSGSTPETLSQFASLVEIFDQKNAKEFFFKNSLIITEDQPSPLVNIAHSNKVTILNHEKNIGGRYSIFSNVGMVPAIIAGLNVEKIHKGASNQIKHISNNEFIKIAQFFRYQNTNNKIKNSVIMTYSDSLFYFGKWYLQLWAESLGKENKGITPIHSIGTTDQHSQLQLYLDGPKDKFFTFITTNHSKKGFKLNNQILMENNINYLIDKTMGDLMQAEQQATMDTFKKNKFSFREIKIPEINEYAIGQLLAFSIMETVATCIYYNVNPFDQPAVEEGKKLAIKYLS